jgi:hypothetical protein
MEGVFVKDIVLPTITKTNGSDCAANCPKIQEKSPRKGA